MGEDAILNAMAALVRFHHHCQKVIDLCKDAGVPYDDLVDDQLLAAYEYETLMLEYRRG